MTKRANFTQAEIARAVAGAIKGGFAVQSVEIHKDGTIKLLPKETEPDNAEEQPKEW